jgi:DNA-binding MarR family transcriptional regulator
MSKSTRINQSQQTKIDELTSEDTISHLIDFTASLKQNTARLDNYKIRTASELKLISLAEKIELFHEIKDRMLGDALSGLGEPVWRILIQLAVANGKGEGISVADVSLRLSIPDLTAIRYVKILEQKKFIVQSPHPRYPMRAQLYLTDHGQSIMQAMLSVLGNELSQWGTG